MSLLQKYYGSQAYESLVIGAIDKMSQQTVYNNVSDTINKITYVIIAVISIMTILIVCLISNMIVNDSKQLAGLLKTLGYTEKENILNFLSIYFPVVIFGLLIASPLSMWMVSIYNAIIFYGLKL